MNVDERTQMDIHQAAYVGNVEAVERLLQRGVNPNTPHETDADWISGPTPLHKVCIAWAMTPKHIEVAKLLIKNGAKVDESHISELAIEMTNAEPSISLMKLLEDNTDTSPKTEINA